MEDKDKRKGWLRELKEGDKVIVNSIYRTSIKTIDKITPTGRIKIGNTQYGHDGWEINGNVWNREYLSQWTQEKENELLKQTEFQKMCNFLQDITWKEKDFEFVKRIYDLVNDLSKL